MTTTPHSVASMLDPASSPSQGELILVNGRLAGVRCALQSPLTVIGSAEGCDIRLRMEDIQPIHCALTHGPQGLMLRALTSANEIYVNGSRITSCTLQDGDVLGIGQFQFRLRLVKRIEAAAKEGVADPIALERERDALRIQAAAVVAQQGALTEVEANLQQHRVALERQEAQLATHLEEKRGQLMQLQGQLRAARTALRTERTAFEQRVQDTLGELNQTRQEVTLEQQQVQAQRRRLLELQRRLKRRWHRHRAQERAAGQRHEHELSTKKRALELKWRQLCQKEKELAEARFCFNGEVELGRRQLEDGWCELRREQHDWLERQQQEQAELRQRARNLSVHEVAFAEEERKLAAEKQEWEQSFLHRQKEAEGLENRIRNQRAKLVEQEQEWASARAAQNVEDGHPTLAQDQPPIASTQQLLVPAVESRSSTSLALREKAREEGKNLSLAHPLPTLQPQITMHRSLADGVEASEQQPCEALEKIVGVLADQRLYLVEQSTRLIQIQQRWQAEHDTAVAETEAVAYQLQQREEHLLGREQTLRALEAELRRQQSEVARQRAASEGAQAEWVARLASWQSERESIRGELLIRETLVQQQMVPLAELRRRWIQRRRREMEAIRVTLVRCQEMRRAYSAQRNKYVQLNRALEQEQRSVAERALALEQCRLEFIATAPNSVEAEKRLERLRRRNAALTAVAERDLARERQSLAEEAGRLEIFSQHIQQQALVLTAREAELSHRVAQREEGHLLATTEQMRLQAELQTTRLQRDVYERQFQVLHDKVEHLALSLIDESDEEGPVSLEQAA